MKADNNPVPVIASCPSHEWPATRRHTFDPTSPDYEKRPRFERIAQTVEPANCPTCARHWIDLKDQEQIALPEAVAA